MTSRWISTFLEAQAAELGAAQNTLLAYGRDLKDFFDWCADQGKTLETAAQSDIEAYLMQLDAQGLAKTTRARRLSAIKQFYAFAYGEGWRDTNPALQIRGPGKEARLPGTLDHETVDKLLLAARQVGRTDADRVRATCLIEILYATGMRVSELVSLPVSAARGNPQVLLVLGKGGKERLVPLSQPAKEALAAWLPIRDAADRVRQKKGAAASAYLFPSRGKSGHLTRHAFYLQIKEMALLCGINPAEISPHTLRHAFATHLLQGGADLLAIQALLGHADVATTEIYTHVLEAHLDALVRAHHPLAKAARVKSKRSTS